MSIFNQGEEPPVSDAKTMETFQDLAESLFASGDIAGVKRLAAEAYLQVMTGRKQRSLDEMRVRQAMGQALQEVLTRGARERHRYFETYRINWWRMK